MIIDCNMFRGSCSCGADHQLTTRHCIIEANCLKNLPAYLAQVGLSGCGIAIYDENTFAATAGSHPETTLNIILPPQNLHADNHGVALALAQLPQSCDYLLAIGAGTIHDITRYCAHLRGIPFVSCPTAASVDGFCSSVAAMTWDGFKKTFPASAPTMVVADTRIIAAAPLFLARSGFGDMAGKFIALADWQIGHLLTGEYFCRKIYDMTYQATQAVLDSAAGILTGDLSAYEQLTYGLVMSGIAMQLLGNSRCASGAEHHISHLIEMEPPCLGVYSDALHGEKVGVGTLLASKTYHKLLEQYQPTRDYIPRTAEDIARVFGDTLRASVVAENKNDAAAGVTEQNLLEKREQITAIIRQIPSYADLAKLYQELGIKATLADIGVPEKLESTLLHHSPLVRNRLTLMRLMDCFC